MGELHFLDTHFLLHTFLECPSYYDTDTDTDNDTDTDTDTDTEFYKKIKI